MGAAAVIGVLALATSNQQQANTNLWTQTTAVRPVVTTGASVQRTVQVPRANVRAAQYVAAQAPYTGTDQDAGIRYSSHSPLVQIQGGLFAYSLLIDILVGAEESQLVSFLHA